MTASSFVRCTPILLAIASAMFAPDSHAEDGRWSNIGPDGGTIYDLEIHPTTPSTMYALAPTGVYKSESAGAFWSRSSEGLPGYRVLDSDLIVDAEQPATIYRYDVGSLLFRSDDDGANWSSVYETSYPLRFFRLIDIPGQVGSLLAVGDYNNDHPVHLYRSVDRGASFVPIGAGLPAGIQIESVAVDPANNQHIIVGMNRVEPPQAQPASIFESQDGGVTFAPSYYDDPDNGIDAETVSGITFSGGGRVIARTGLKLAINDANGASGAWKMTNYSPASLLKLVFVHPLDRDVVYVVDYSSNKVLRLTIGDVLMNPIPVTVADISTGLSANPTVSSVITGSPGAPRIYRLVADPGFPASGSRLYVATGEAGVMGTLNGGDGINSGFSFWSNANLNAGLRGSHIATVSMHPQSPGRLYAGFLSDYGSATPGVLGSQNAGNNWSPLQTGLGLSGVNAIAIDPTTTASPASTRLYAAGSGIGEYGFATIGLFRSNNGGANWSPLNGDFAPFGTPPNLDFRFRRLDGFAFDPRACASQPYDPQGPTCSSGPLTGFLASGDGRCSGIAPAMQCTDRLFRSTDNGNSYQSLDSNPGFTSSIYFADSGELKYIRYLSPSAILVDPTNSARMFVPLMSSVNDLDLGDAFSPDAPSGVMYSEDGGANWSARSTGLPKGIAGYSGNTPIYWSMLSVGLLAGANHPGAGDTLWVATDFPSTVYKTVNGGVSWAPSDSGLSGAFSRVRVLTVDPGDPDVIYATGLPATAASGAVFRSDDGGANWRSISVGLPPIALHSLSIDPFNPALLYASSDSGVWTLNQVPDFDGDGAPDATENNAPNSGDGNADGQPDAAQRDVGSSVIIIRRLGISGFFTSDIRSELSTPTTSGGCAQAKDVQGRFALEFGRDYATPFSNNVYNYPRDLLQLEILDCARALVDVRFHNADFSNEYGWSFRFHGPDTPGSGVLSWHDFSARATATAADGWRLTLDANQFGSHRPFADRILFIGGPACYDDRLFRNGMETQPDNGPPSCNH